MNKEKAIFQLGYCIGVIFRYRTIIKDFYNNTKHLKDAKTITEDEQKKIMETLNNAAAALLDENKELTMKKPTGMTTITFTKKEQRDAAFCILAEGRFNINFRVLDLSYEMFGDSDEISMFLKLLSHLNPRVKETL